MNIYLRVSFDVDHHQAYYKSYIDM